MSLHISPEIERRLAEAAKAAGTTPDLLAEEYLKDRLDSPAMSNGAGNHARTLEDFLGEFIGYLDSGDDNPEIAHLSENTGERFTDLLIEQRAQGRL